MTTSGYDIRYIMEEAQVRWLKPAEVLLLLQNYNEKQLTHEAPQKPPSGSVFLFDRKVLRFFRKDGHSWRRKKDGKALGEAHERLKVGNVEALNCYYAHGEHNPYFQRRSYWMLKSEMDHIVLVHYRDTNMGRNMTGPLSAFSPGSSSILVQSSNSSYASQLTTSNETGEPYESRYSPTSLEVSSDSIIEVRGTTEETKGSPNSEVDQALRRIEEQLSLDDDQLIDIDGLYKNETSYDSGLTFDEQSYMFLEDLNFSSNTHVGNVHGSNLDYSAMFDQEHIQTESSLTIEQDQKFTIREISPEWGYANETTKVFFIGTFTSGSWTCMFGDTEVPVQIIQEGVICCQAPPCVPGKVNIFISFKNQKSQSEVKEFEYRDKLSSFGHNLKEKESNKSLEELLLLVRLVQMLQSNQVEDSWGQLIEALLDGSLESSNAIDWILEQLLKDKLHQWLSSRLNENSVLSKREQGMIHMVSGLGFCWALSPILKSGVSVNFRDINGWTALHWAARFGREKMVAELLACGAFAGAITDPSNQDPTGKTPASIAYACGHKGLAGYLSEMALTGHLSSLTLQQSEVSRTSADVEAERTVNSLAAINEDHLCLKDTLTAVRNATQAAARIQSAFRAHSFRKRQQKEYGSEDEYGILESEIEGISKGSKLTFRNAHDNNHAALSIQKKYRGWKGRKDFVALRQKVVKIQAHVRGHQVRKSYKVICWAVGMVDKIILRWRRKGAGLRGFRQLDCANEDEEGEEENVDFVKAFRKEKVDVAIGEAVSRVLSMVDSQPARQQYRRVLQNHQQAKAERGGFGGEVTNPDGLY